MSGEGQKQAPRQFVDLDAKVGEVTVADLLGAIMFAIEQKRSESGARLGDLTAEEFTARMLDVFKSRAFAGAAAEAQIAERVLADWQGLMKVNAVAQPFRVASEADADAMAENLKSTLRTGLKGHLLIAVGVVGTDNASYAPYVPAQRPAQPVYSAPPGSIPVAPTFGTPPPGTPPPPDQRKA